MRSRLLAGAVLLASGLIAWLAISFMLAARLLQAAVGLSVVYVGYLAYRGWRVMRADIRRSAAGEAPVESSAGSPGPRPRITILVPAANEAAVIAETVRQLAAQDYAEGGERCFDVLVVDDGSSDGTGELAREAGATLPDHVRVVRREPGSGPATKAAVLAFATPWVTGEVLAVVDADARVRPDFLARSVDAWQRDPGAAGIQAQRRSHNAPHRWLAAAQDEELLMDMASQCGRWATDGTAELRGNGMFLRRSELERVGGWDAGALTEDLEISTRLTRGGAHIALAPTAEVGEEAVEAPADLWRQRMRWAEGSMRRLMEHGPGLLADGRLPLGRRLDFLLFVTEFVVPPLFVTTIVASLLTVLQPVPADWTVPVSLFIGYGLGTFLLAMAGLAAHGTRGVALVGRSARGALFLSHWLIVVPAALLRIALLPPTRDFARTPRSSRTHVRTDR